ncbi:MAG: metallopeptidase family protein [Propionicimonas sp.]|uniref:metallopeptidase family protein n=1 Tax=Propionicimonas sp. TaxID=1955623 RepID=UPI002B220CE9|nr:metallopeptidase family protein [Propionicimonas sp.]MEA4944803.1 metallopeptidase family protein [Propionicimonas sp.]MEA5051951.1 metallopeptidase family protein [Propionicimonas sp.]MEA5117353.1 metallopeptidase family protein [Propionicimonas sp.]
MAVDMSPEEFDLLVDQALSEIPGRFLGLIENCVVIVEDEPAPSDPELFGYYDGIPLSERSFQYGGVLPDRIVIFRGPLLRHCLDADEVVEEVRITVWHEVAHFFGIDDGELDELGYA